MDWVQSLSVAEVLIRGNVPEPHPRRGVCLQWSRVIVFALRCAVLPKHTDNLPARGRGGGVGVHLAHVAIAAFDGVVAGASEDFVLACGPGPAVGIWVQVIGSRPEAQAHR